MPKHVVLISPHEAMIDCVKSHKIEYTIIDKAGARYDYQDVESCALFLFDYHNEQLCTRILEAINENKKIDAIVTLTENALPVAANLSEYFNLPSTPMSIVKLIHDKASMRESLSSFDNYSINFLQPKNLHDLHQFAEENGFPFIIKPKKGVGSKGVLKIEKMSDLKSITFTEELIAEQFILGDEYSVEFFSFNGDHKMVSVTEKNLISSSSIDNFTEIGHTIPAEINKNLKSHIEKYVSTFLDIIGLKDGPSHTEIKVAGGVINIIETHNRIGGDRISSLVKISTGVDLVELSILWPLNLCKPIESPIHHNVSASIRFFNPKPGKLLSIDGIETAKQSRSIIDVEVSCKTGDLIKPINDSFGRYGFLIATGVDTKEARTNAYEASSKIKFNISG
ncbi:ATP-grasp domain-containing protein [Candidatus Sororendozoicomonas aggregata]|uniref:ATP-grasp domain-containing protein n=1 Tax=Candidatus Sororendozoicomonas aggregata TaxID=3073239 RepID=UPI002ED0F406